MPVDEPRTAFDPASRRPSNPAEESGSPPPSGKRLIGGSRGEAAWQHPHQVKGWFAHIDDRREGIMMARLVTRVTRLVSPAAEIDQVWTLQFGYDMVPTASSSLTRMGSLHLVQNFQNFNQG